MSAIVNEKKLLSHMIKETVGKTTLRRVEFAQSYARISSSGLVLVLKAISRIFRKLHKLECDLLVKARLAFLFRGLLNYHLKKQIKTAGTIKLKKGYLMEFRSNDGTLRLRCDPNSNPSRSVTKEDDSNDGEEGNNEVLGEMKVETDQVEDRNPGAKEVEEAKLEVNDGAQLPLENNLSTRVLIKEEGGSEPVIPDNSSRDPSAIKAESVPSTARDLDYKMEEPQKEAVSASKLATGIKMVAYACRLDDVHQKAEKTLADPGIQEQVINWDLSIFVEGLVGRIQRSQLPDGCTETVVMKVFLGKIADTILYLVGAESMSQTIQFINDETSRIDFERKITLETARTSLISLLNLIN
ncbi:hypothetical protein CRE_05098 [Caenorhabditis remanei]|uniref:Uncharacterized protein n=1 Tax=Caenorhabditis remanei TaxID=31234 RepID=E3MZ61_CAERE|nr:hypothetical protein CRE_05098 [Caenorhabditis remanei]